MQQGAMNMIISSTVQDDGYFQNKLIWLEDLANWVKVSLFLSLCQNQR